MKLRENYTCPLEFVHDIVKGKWKPIIIFNLRKGPLSLSELESSIEGISQKMLLEQLKELKTFGVVDKTTFEGYPLKVAYYLTTDKGQRLLEAVELMQEIGIQMMVENHQTDLLDEKGIPYQKFIKNGN